MKKGLKAENSRGNFRRKGDKEKSNRKNSYLDRFNKKIHKGDNNDKNDKPKKKQKEQTQKRQWVDKPREKQKKPIDLNEESLREIIKPPERITDLIRSEYDEIIENHNVIFSTRFSRKREMESMNREMESLKRVNLNVQKKEKKVKEDFYNNKVTEKRAFKGYSSSSEEEQEKEIERVIQTEQDYKRKESPSVVQKKEPVNFVESERIEVDSKMNIKEKREEIFEEEREESVDEEELKDKMDINEQLKPTSPKTEPIEPLSFSNIITSNKLYEEEEEEKEEKEEVREQQTEQEKQDDDQSEEEDFPFEQKVEKDSSDNFNNRYHYEEEPQYKPDNDNSLNEVEESNEFVTGMFTKTMNSEDNMFGEPGYRKPRRPKTAVMDSTDMVNAMKRNSSKDIAGFNSESSVDEENIFESKVKKMSVRFCDDNNGVDEYMTNTFNYDVTKEEDNVLQSIIKENEEYKNDEEPEEKRETTENDKNVSFGADPLPVPPALDDSVNERVVMPDLGAKDISFASDISGEKEERMKRVITFADVHKANNDHSERITENQQILEDDESPSEEDKGLENYFANKQARPVLIEEGGLDRKIQERMNESNQSEEDSIDIPPPTQPTKPYYDSEIPEQTKEKELIGLKKKEGAFDFNSWEQNLGDKETGQVDLNILQEITDIYRDTNLTKSEGRSSQFTNQRESNPQEFKYNFFEEEEKMKTIMENDEESQSSENLDKFTMANKMGFQDKESKGETKTRGIVSDSMDIKSGPGGLGKGQHLPEEYKTFEVKKNSLFKPDNSNNDKYQSFKKDKALEEKPKRATKNLNQKKSMDKETKKEEEVVTQREAKKETKTVLTEEEFDEKFNMLIVKMLNKKAVLIQRQWRLFIEEKKKSINLTSLFKEFLQIKRRNENFVRKNHNLKGVQTNPYSIKIVQKEFHERLDEKASVVGVSGSLNKMISEVNFVTEKLGIFADS